MGQKAIGKLHYLTADDTVISHAEMAELACIGGCRWVQLRIKNKTLDDCLIIAKEVKKITDRFDAVLIINDHVEIAKAIFAHGVHLGKNDMQVSAARRILGYRAIIGGTANSKEDIYSLTSEGVDYIGLGPYRFTSSKKDLSPVLGLEGYRELLGQISSAIPVVAIGGIRKEDTELLMGAGLYGIAISSAINSSGNIAAEAKNWVELMNKYNTKEYAANC